MRALEPSPCDAPRAWESAFAAHYVGLCEYVLRLVGSAEAAQDVVQDLFLHLWDTRGPRDAVRLTQPYLYVAARNRALKYLRHRQVAAAWIERAASEETPAVESPDDRCLRDELDRAVQRAIADLPERCREIFLLRRRDHCSYEEIASCLQVSLGTVKSQMWRATVRLKKTLTPYLTHAAPVVTRGHASYRVL
jgi:RNA polymerase sigma-19 factor, ECF subfamily